jgi:hypothetical protein
MPALFPPWTNTAMRIGIVGIVAAGGCAIAAPMIYVRTPYRRGQFEPPDQPVMFDHRHHARDDGIDCRYCHDTVEKEATAGIPSTDVCMGCHSQVWMGSPMLEPVRRSYFSGAAIPWNRVHDLPGFVYFNHAIHVNKGIGCVSCHGRVDQMATVVQVESLTMGFCLDCHRNPEPHLRPRDRITQMDWRPNGDPVALGKELAAEYQTRKLTQCTACHR